MSREIVVLRHAQAEPQAGMQSDFERGLSARGRTDATAVRRWFDQHKMRFDRVLSSPSRRTRETAELAAPEGAAVDYEQEIYDATPGTLITVLERAAEPGCTLLIGHNPGLEQLVALLCEGRSDEYRGLPTSGVAVLTVPEGAAIEPGSAQLRAFWSP